MRRKQNIQDSFKSVVPEYEAGPWSVGYSGHSDGSLLFSELATPDGISGVTLIITDIRNITDQFVPGTSDVVTNDVYVDYSIMSGATILATGTTSIYDYPTTTTTTTSAPTTTTTTTHAATTTTTTLAPTTTTTTT